MKGIQIQLPLSNSQKYSEKPQVDLQALITSFNSEHKQFRWNRLGSNIKKSNDSPNSLQIRKSGLPRTIGNYYGRLEFVELKSWGTSSFHKHLLRRDFVLESSFHISFTTWKSFSSFKPSALALPFLPPHRLRGWCEETFIGLSVGERELQMWDNIRASSQFTKVLLGKEKQWKRSAKVYFRLLPLLLRDYLPPHVIC